MASNETLLRACKNGDVNTIFPILRSLAMTKEEFIQIGGLDIVCAYGHLNILRDLTIFYPTIQEKDLTAKNIVNLILRCHRQRIYGVIDELYEIFSLSYT